MLDDTIETVDGIATDPEKTLEKIGAKLKEVKNACTQAVLAVSLIATDPEIRSRVLTDIYNTPTRDKVKSVVKISSELLLQTNILKSAIFVGSNTIDMAKFAQRRSKNILVAAQGFLESPHTVIAEEVSVLWGNWHDLEKTILHGQEYAKINGQLFTRHAVERMIPINYGESWLMGVQGRGVPTSVVEDVIKNGIITETRIKNKVTRICKTIDRINVILENDIVISVLIKS